MHLKTISLFVFLNCSLVINSAFSAEAIKEKIINTKLKGSFLEQMILYDKLFKKAFKEKNEEKGLVYFMRMFSTYADYFESLGSNSQGMLPPLEYFRNFSVPYEEKNPGLMARMSEKCKKLTDELKKTANECKETPKKKKKKKYAVDGSGRTELHNLVRSGNLKGVQAVLASNCSAEYFNMRSGERRIHVLHYAAGRAYNENGFAIAKLLIEYALSKGYDLNVKTLNGRTPLDVARDFHNKELVDLLTANGAR